MSPMSDYLQDQLRKHVFRTGSFTKPATLFVSLHTANPTDAGSGAEVSGGSYARVQRDPLDANWSSGTPTDGITNNVAAITFPSPSANWGVITHCAIWDAVTAGNMICYATLTTPKTVNSGDAAPSFLAASLVWTWV
jgi:hypothetical protein